MDYKDLQLIKELGVEGGIGMGAVGLGIGAKYGYTSKEEADMPEKLARGAGGALIGGVAGVPIGAGVGAGSGLAGLKLRKLIKGYSHPVRNTSYFSYMDKNAQFMNLVAVGAGLGGVKGMLDQPAGQLVDPNTGQIVSRVYTPLERVVNIGTNTAIGAGLGWGGNKLGLNDPRQIGRYIGQMGNYIDEQLSGLRRYVPKVEVRTSTTSPTPVNALPEKLQRTINNSTRWL